MRKAHDIEEGRSEAARCTIAPVPCIGGEYRSYRGVAQPFPAHSHEHYVVGLVTQGARRLVWNDQPHLLEPGDLFVFNPGDVHGCQQQGSGLLAFESLTFSADFAEGIRLRGPRTRSADAVALFRAVIDNLNAPGETVEGSETRASGAVPAKTSDRKANVPASPETRRPANMEAVRKSTLALLNFLAETDSPDADAAGTPAAADSVLGPTATPILDDPAGRTFRHLAGNLANPSRLHQIAQRETLSDAALIRAYRRRFRITPMQHLASLRIERACKLLADGMEPAAVAAETGFADQAHLTREFKRREGLTPGSYRRQLAAAGECSKRDGTSPVRKDGVS